MKAIDRPDQIPFLWGVGRFPGSSDPYFVSQADMDRDVAGAARVIERLGAEAGEHVLFVSHFYEGCQFWPLERAAIERDVVISCAEANLMDAPRVEFFTRLLPLAAAVGVTADTLDGVEQLGLDLQEVFDRPRVVLARPGAYERLRAAGVEARRIVALGPALVTECAAGELHVDGDEWDVVEHDGELVISGRGKRATDVASFGTGLRGRTLGTGTCGSPDPVVDIET